jgi:hypothetical protein
VTLRRRLALLRATCVIGLALLGAAFLGFLAPVGWHSIVRSALAAGFVLAIAASIALACVRCPACGRRLAGSSDPGDVAPAPRLFTRKCRHCGHVPD